jgi:hypothetical protein
MGRVSFLGETPEYKPWEYRKEPTTNSSVVTLYKRLIITTSS